MSGQPTLLPLLTSERRPRTAFEFDIKFNACALPCRGPYCRLVELAQRRLARWSDAIVLCAVVRSATAETSRFARRRFLGAPPRHMTSASLMPPSSDA